jgi:AraC family transcriptional regulator, alkane utilization regulator
MACPPEFLTDPPAGPAAPAASVAADTPDTPDTPDMPDATAGVMNDVLRWLRLGGALFVRAEFTAPWAYASPAAHDLAAALRPGARRLILFHLVPEGRCVLTLPQGDPVALQAGDVIILPYADQHCVAQPAEAPPVPIVELMPRTTPGELPIIRHGGGGDRTQIVCGYLHSDELRFNPVLGTLPALMHLRPPPGGPLAAWVDASFRYALHAGARGGDDPLLQRLPELLFAECLRLYASSGGRGGWFAALADPVLGRALALLHADPAQAWTLDSLAAAAGTSRSRLDARCRARLGMAPMAYLTQWRLQMAAQLLRSTTLGIAAVAERVGYGSEASLSRAFKRFAGAPPAAWRRPADAAAGATATEA